VAHLLISSGTKTAVIQGGLRAWRKAGLPIERVPADEMESLPVFES
jgi:hypothetical protein